MLTKALHCTLTRFASSRCGRRRPRGGRLLLSPTLLTEGPVLVGNVEVPVAHAPQAAAGDRVAAGHFASIALHAGGPVLVGSVTNPWLTPLRPQAAAGGRLTGVVDNVEVFVAHAPQVAAGGRVAAGLSRRPHGGSRRQRRSFRRSRPSGGRRRPVAAGFSRQDPPSLLSPNQKPNKSVTTNKRTYPLALRNPGVTIVTMKGPHGQLGMFFLNGGVSS